MGILLIGLMLLALGLMSITATRQTRRWLVQGSTEQISYIAFIFFSTAVLLPLALGVAARLTYESLGWQVIFLPGVGMIFSAHLLILSAICAVRSRDLLKSKLVLIGDLMILALWLWTAVDRFM